MRILVAGIGNIFHGDDAFGVEVARRFVPQDMQDATVDVRDFGIRGYDLGFALSDGYDAAILVDAVQRGEAPGTLYLLDLSSHDKIAATIPMHDLTPTSALSFARCFGPLPRTVRLVGCEPLSIDEAMGLTPAVEAAVGRATTMISQQVEALCTSLA